MRYVVVAVIEVKDGIGLHQDRDYNQDDYIVLNEARISCTDISTGTVIEQERVRNRAAGLNQVRHQYY